MIVCKRYKYVFHFIVDLYLTWETESITINVGN